MPKKNDPLRKTAPLSVIRGEQVKATYLEQLIPEYKGNPLLEALPPLWTIEEVTQMLSHYPHYDQDQTKLADEVRLHLLENAREFFIPQGIHYEIHLSISNMLRRGYIDRNPVKLGMWIDQRSKINQLENRLQRRPFLRSKARGLCIVGIGGVGKSTAVENILSLYPQVITHTSYKGQDLILKQLVWVKLQCPSDGSLKSLCINYIEEVDDILGTNYIQRYGVRSRNADQLLLIMARIASIHFLGLIVFDEIQDLSEAKSGGATRMLNFFVQLENTLGIPFVLIGTPKAKALLSGEFRQARRISEQGDIY
jgi:AAA domain